MPTQAKQATVAELKDELSNSRAAIVADYRGLTVSDISAVRRTLRVEGISYRVVKNRLAKIAATEVGRGELNEMLEGPTALALGKGDEVLLARTFLEAIRPYKTVTIRGALLGDRRIDAASVARLATLPPREVLLAQLAGGMISPVAMLASLFSAPLRNLGYALTQLVDQKGQAEGATEVKTAKAEAAEVPATAEATAEADEAPPAEASADPEATAEADEAPAAEATVEAPAEADEASAAEDATPEAQATAEASVEMEATAEAESSAETEAPAESATEVEPVAVGEASAEADASAEPEPATEDNQSESESANN